MGGLLRRVGWLRCSFLPLRGTQGKVLVAFYVKGGIVGVLKFFIYGFHKIPFGLEGAHWVGLVESFDKAFVVLSEGCLFESDF